LVVPNAAHVGSTIGSWYCPFITDVFGAGTEVKDAECNEDDGVHQNFILDNLPLAQEHLVFKFSSIDPHIKCSEIVASVNVTKVTPGVITSVIIALRDLLPMVGLHVGMATSDAAGCNWVSYRDTLSSHTFRDVLPRVILDKYPMVDFDVKCLMTNPVTNEWTYVRAVDGRELITTQRLLKSEPKHQK